ncbi:hypothetical protein [uncultured Maricaulis sp.]|uniref:hypothetical protein n=1 Tax=uncultured Maricaulis sp. TaxID=174710 RepID=UPI0030D74B93|tara:strand:+ start:2050 stop:2931 length:882 start_codon:yes stop_codon:yes gene_type:complete
MSASTSTTTPQRLWLCMTDSPRVRTLSRVLAEGMDVTVYLGPLAVPDAPVAVMLVDDANAALVATARKHAAPNQKTILVTASSRGSGTADLHLPGDIDAASLATVIEGLLAYRSFEASPAAALEPVMALHSASFSVRTMDEASRLSNFLAATLPCACEMAVGLHVLLANAIEFGNLGFSASEKAQGLAVGNWQRKLAQRAAEPAYASRCASVEFQRGERLVTMLVQDDGDGISVEADMSGDPSRPGHRERMTKVLKALGFAELTWLGGGATAAASVVLGRSDKPAPGRAGKLS